MDSCVHKRETCKTSEIAAKKPLCSPASCCVRQQLRYGRGEKEDLLTFFTEERIKTMQRTSKQKALLEGDVQQVDEKLLTLMRRLGIESLPAHKTMLLPIERIIVPGALLITRPSKRLVKSMQR